MGPIRLERWGDEMLAVLNGMDGDEFAVLEKRDPSAL